MSKATESYRWSAVNKRCLDLELQRIRLLLERRMLWLRKLWKQDPLQAHQGLVISDAKADLLITGDDGSAEAQFYAKEPRAAAIARALAETDHAISTEVDALAERGEAAAIDVLVRLFGLSRFERDVVLLCLAPELDPSFEWLYAYVQDDVTRKYPTPHLALSLFGGDDWQAARESLMPNGQLRRFRLISLDAVALPGGAVGSTRLSMPERLVNYLIGINVIDDRASELLRPMPPALLSPDQVDSVDRLQRLIESKDRQIPWPAINIFGPPGSGRAAFAKALCERLRLQLFRFNALQLPSSEPDRHEALRLIEREAALSQFAVYIDMTKVDDALQPNARLLVEDVVEQLGVFAVIASRDRFQSERRVIAIQSAKLGAASQRALWQQALSEVAHSLNGEIEGLAEQFEFGPAGITRSIVSAKDRARLRSNDGDPAVTADDLWHACREQAGWQLDQLAHRITPCHSWEDIILPDDAYQQLQEIAGQVFNRFKVYESWGFGAKLSRGRGISALFSGPSGTGKTLAAEILANHLKLSLYRIDLSGVVSKYIGETEKNLRKVFDAAEQSGAILFFDEADALFGKRSEVKDSHDRYANIEINYLLQRMEDYRGLAILATNMKSHLDKAFMRRLRFLVDFPFPDAVHRAMIWQCVFPEAAARDGLDYSALSRLEISGGNIKNIAVNAAFLAASSDAPICMEHVLQAARREYAKIDKLMLEYEFGDYCPSTK